MSFESFLKSNIYNIITSLLALIVVITLFLDLTFDLPGNIIWLFDKVNFLVWIIFTFDYVYRLYISENKKAFILNNKIDLISILPFNEILQGFRIIKAFKLLKLTKLFKLTIFLSNYIKRLNKFLKLNNFNYVLYITITTIIIGAYSISIVENMDFKDSLWWSFVTTTTVGYGDISPRTGLGRIIATILMLVGIGFLSMLTGTIATFFLGKKEERIVDYKTETIEAISDKIKNDFNNLSEKDLDDMLKVLKTLKNN